MKTDNAHANGDLLQIGPHVGGIVVKVLVDARLGTVLIDLSTVSPGTAGMLSSGSQQRNSLQPVNVGSMDGCTFGHRRWCLPSACRLSRSSAAPGARQ